MRQNAFCGFLTLVDNLAIFLSKPEGMVLFKHKYGHERELSEEVFLAKSRKQHTRELDHLSQIKELMKKGKPYAVFKGQRENMTKGREEFRAEFEGFKLPDASKAIPNYMKDECTRKFFCQLSDMAYEIANGSGQRIAKKTMLYITRELIKRLHLKNGHRIQVFGLFSRGGWFDAISKGSAAYPYKGIGDGKHPGQKWSKHQHEQGTDFMVMDDPHGVSLKEATHAEKEEWQLTRGIAVRIKHHKTGGKYPLWLWFSNIDQVCYITYSCAYIYVC